MIFYSVFANEFLPSSRANKILLLMKSNHDDWALRLHIIQEVRYAIETVKFLGRTNIL